MQSPVKSSNEILSELFGAFNAKPPEITEPALVESSLDKSSSDNEAKIVDKDKKKSKHHKSKKSKKRSRHLSDSDHKKKKKKKKDEKHKHKSKHHKKKSKTKENLENSSSSSDSEKSDKSSTTVDLSKVKIEKVADGKPAPESQLLNDIAPPTENQTSQGSAIDLSDIEPPKGEPLKPFVQSIKKEDDNVDVSQVSANNDSAVDSEKLNKIKSDGENCNATSKVEEVFAVEIEKPKPAVGGKIMIKNLKFSSVFEETVKQVEEQARLKAERYEEGELSDSSSNLRSESKSSSPVPSVEFEAAEKAQSPVKSSRSKHSPSRREHRKRSRSSDKRKHKTSGRSHSSHRSHKDRKTSHRSRSGSRSRLKAKDPYSSKDKDPYLSKERDATKRRRSSERSDSRHHHHHHHHSRHPSRKESDHHDSHRSSDDRHKDGGGSKHGRKRSASPARKKPHRSRSRSRSKATSPRRKERRSSQEKIDKHKLLEIARKNALTMLKQAPPTVGTEPAKATIAAGGKTVDELTDFCKLLSKKDAEGHESISSNTSDSDASESEKPFHHPFQIKDRPSSIVLNIRNAVPMPLKTLQEKTAEQSKVLSQQFPVSSGQLHRKKESDWVPVSPKKDTENIPLPILPAPVPPPAALATGDKSSSPFVPPLPPLEPPPLPPESIFPVTKETSAPAPQRIDVSTIMTQRLKAMRQLEKNPDDVHARNQMNKAELHMQAWAESKYEPGQFTGSTGARILTPHELAPGSQAWTRPAPLANALRC